MFDDIPQEKMNKKEGAEQDTQPTPQATSPLEKPSAVEAGALQPKGQGGSSVEDIFEGVATGGDGGQRQTSESSAHPLPEKNEGAKSKVLIALLAILVVVLLVTGGVFAYFQFFGGQDTPADGQMEEHDTTQLPNGGGQMEEEQDTSVQPTVPTQPTTPTTPTQPDSDGDGLTDEQEQILGTDPELVDTDEDGLLDQEEVQNYNTNPLNPDTDGDGFTDGTEVANGYNPNGEGTLLEQQETEQ